MQQEQPDLDDGSDEEMEDADQRDETSQLIKNLVRYALACEYSRTPIRRDGIKDKGTECSPVSTGMATDVSCSAR